MANSTDAASCGAKELQAVHPDTEPENNQVLPELSAGEVHLRGSISPTVIQPMKDKNREWEAIKSKGASLTLLDLPVDVLRLIVNEITYTNDLIALALTNSALYKLAVPNIYSCFDIVWPGPEVTVQSYKSVDALSYGLATLCLSSRFAEKAKHLYGVGTGQPRGSHRLANNEHAKYVRKFSIGDGPPEWTSEYHINRESGKMLGTLAAIAVSKMVNLETFVWNMSTGVLSDVFMALASLQDDKGQSKLEKVWVRWHDNSSMTPSSSSASTPTTLPPQNPLPPLPPPTFAALAQGTMPTSVGNYIPANPEGAVLQAKSYAQSCVEYPTFSILPPLKSLTVLDIDDLSYLDEMSVLIERSASRLQELRVGISKKAYSLLDFAQPWDGINLQQVDHDAKWPGESRIPTTRLGGVLGVLVGRVYDIRRKDNSREKSAPERNIDLPSGMETLGLPNETNKAPQPQDTAHSGFSGPRLERKRLDGKLKLQTLALERVSLSIAVCSRAIDWSNMTSLTILNCLHHETLWKTLKRQFKPTPPAHGSPEGAPALYHLSLKHLHTDLVSSALMNFMKETIAPNTMETIFLQDRQRSLKPCVTLEQVFKSTVKRHRSSLKKLLIDSSDKKSGTLISGVPGRWKHWIIKDEYLAYITSGRMTSLRELGIVIDYKDWHRFVQQLPGLANLRSLYIPNMMSARLHRRAPTPQELALQIVDIISLRREIRLAYVGLWTKCFEIMEADPNDSANNTFQEDDDHGVYIDDMDGNSEGDDETEDDDNGNDDFIDAEDELTEVSDDGRSEADSFEEAVANRLLPRLRLRQIFSYEDKVELFRARHGKL
ncbi:hypothetical protein HD806DRAFT_482522 [Xylariaceae sp. AK1471]|nr:hypothetical protein HD806DRAFT_482522 [Xylariaceae sp. AK1471]